jgi:antitoxin HicB
LYQYWYNQHRRRREATARRLLRTAHWPGARSRLVRALDRADRKIIGEDIKDVEFSWPIGMPLCRSLWRTVGNAQRVDAREDCARGVLHSGKTDGAAPRLHQENAEDTSGGHGSSVEKEKGDHMKRKGRIGSSFDDFLKEDGIYEEVTARAIKRVIARQLDALMEEQGLTKSALAKRMKTSRAQLDRLLDPDNESVTLGTLTRAAQAVGRQLRMELV